MPPPSITCSSIVLIFEHVLFLLAIKVRCATLERFNHVNLLANEGIKSEDNEDVHETEVDDDDSYQSDTVLLGESEAEDDYGSGSSNSNSSGSWVPECLDHVPSGAALLFPTGDRNKLGQNPSIWKRKRTRYKLQSISRDTAIAQETSDQRARPTATRTLPLSPL
ncbi:hypothetical protein DFQ26_008625 [Actinomortierella ambigua]|nr:hypothetical protein DFQ26_008625 [Actinomortierella ambigua]